MICVRNKSSFVELISKYAISKFPFSSLDIVSKAFVELISKYAISKFPFSRMILQKTFHHSSLMLIKKKSSAFRMSEFFKNSTIVWGHSKTMSTKFYPIVTPSTPSSGFFLDILHYTYPLSFDQA